MKFGFTVVLQTSSHWHSNRWKTPSLKKTWFYSTNLYSFNADKTDTWNNEQVLRFCASSSVWCGDWCGSALTTLTLTCCVFSKEKTRKYKVWNTDLLLEVIFTQLYRSRSVAKMRVESTATLLESTFPPPPYCDWDHVAQLGPFVISLVSCGLCEKRFLGPRPR